MIEGFQYISSTGIVDAARYGSNDRVLPNLLMSLALDDNQVVRFSASKSMSRPSLQDLRSQLSFYNRDYITPVASGGNPNLEPLGSTNIDLAYENYYAEGSYFAVNAFYKEIEDFISSSTEYSTVGNITNPAAGTYAFAVSCVQEWVAAGRPQTGFPGDAGATGHCVSQQALWSQGWMNDFQHMGWVAVAMSRGVDVSNGFPWAGCGDYDGWWRCDPGYVDGSSADPLAVFEITRPMNLETGEVSGVEVTLQHLFEGTPYGMQFNYTAVSGGDVEVDTNVIGEQFILPGLGDSGNLSFFFEDDKHTARLALNYRGEVIAGFGNYQQPLFVEARAQVDASYQYRINEDMTLFLDMMNITDETTRLFARHSEMLFLSQDHGPVFKLGFRANF
jgi:TonB-dependent receptor